MWQFVVGGLVIYRIAKRWYNDDDDAITDKSNPLFLVAKRLEKLYRGSKAYVYLRIPDPDSVARRNIDLVLVTNQEAVVISVNNVSGFVTTDKDGNWLCADEKQRKTERIPNPVAEAKESVSILGEYLQQRGVDLPEGYLSFKVICPNPNFRSIDPDSFPPEVITYDQWTVLKPEQGSLYSGWIKGAILCGKKKNKMQESFSDKLNSVLITAPTWDRLELKGHKSVLGEFIEFKGKQEDLQALRKIKRSKVSHFTTTEKISMFGLAGATVQVFYASRDYRAEGPSSSSQWEEVTVRSSTEVVFQPQILENQSSINCLHLFRCHLVSDYITSYRQKLSGVYIV